MAEPDLRARIDAENQHEGWRRVRVGLAGLGGIVLIIALANAMLDRIVEKAGGPLVADQSSPSGNAAAAEKPAEPMAELGVAPGAPEVVPTQPEAPVKAK
jgi:hypothetical protein